MTRRGWRMLHCETCQDIYILGEFNESTRQNETSSSPTARVIYSHTQIGGIKANYDVNGSFIH